MTILPSEKHPEEQRPEKGLPGSSERNSAMNAGSWSDGWMRQDQIDLVSTEHFGQRSHPLCSEWCCTVVEAFAVFPPCYCVTVRASVVQGQIEKTVDSEVSCELL
jgi:hypothetical protein